jgi:hypothetical protein
VAAAKDGDVIEIASGEYVNDWAKIRANDLTIRGLPEGDRRPRLVTKDAMITNGKAIFVAGGNNLTVENIEFVGSRVEDKNGCGIRGDGKGLIVRHCRFYDCEHGIAGTGGEVLIEHCEFDHCGHSAGSVATHSVYIHDRCTKLTFRYNYSTHTMEGHLLKTCSKENWILYNRLTDEEGLGSAVADIPFGGVAVVVGNVLHKGPKSHNNRMIAFGMQGLKYERNEIYVVNNSMWFDSPRTSDTFFVRVETKTLKVPGATSQPARMDVKTVIRNNVCVGVVPLTNAAKPDESGNLLFKTVAEAGFADPAKYDFSLKAGSPCIGAAVDCGKVGDLSLKPDLQYLHPHDKQARPDDGKLDVGAFEFAARK